MSAEDPATTSTPIRSPVAIQYNAKIYPTLTEQYDFQVFPTALVRGAIPKDLDREDTKSVYIRYLAKPQS